MKRSGPIVVAFMFLTACSADSSAASFEVTEFSISGPETIASGGQNLDVVNSGQFPHTLVVTDPAGQVVAATGLIQPGETSAIEFDLNAGRYSLTCRIVAQNDEGELIDHFEAGMHTSLTVDG